ncbi:hypothetical protein [Sulfitobacter sp. M22]|uniref:hypothetical protein n=1 Tax=Sulfitobacter sp. M22 TaxID=2675332 RepID=UPI001F1B7C3F|nr:hypothetical protein [Sulfitobacter sp. M22]MCF7728109.1 hypothetical protein [Sulfitobacter sp. M22]
MDARNKMISPNARSLILHGDHHKRMNSSQSETTVLKVINRPAYSGKLDRLVETGLDGQRQQIILAGPSI